MSVRFDAAADRLLRTTDLLNYNQPYTVMAWVRFNATPTTWTGILSLNVDSASTNYDYIGCGNTGEWYIEQAGGTAGSASGSNPVGATWYHIAIVRNSAGSGVWALYVNGVLNASVTVNPTGRAAVTRNEFGAFTSVNIDSFNGRVYAIKAWSAALSVNEILNEMNFIRPSRFENLYGFWPTFPGATERLADYGGNVRNWTAGGTLTDEDPPPVSWGATPYWVNMAAAAAAAASLVLPFPTRSFSGLIVR